NAVTAWARTVTDALTNGTTTITSMDAAFTGNDVNQLVSGDGITGGTRIASVTDASHAVLTNAASTSLVGGTFTILGTTVNFGSVSGSTLIPGGGGFAGGSVGHQIEGLMIPGGSTITGVFNANAIDISQPSNGLSNANTIKEWTQGRTKAQMVTTGPDAGKYLKATGTMAQVYLVDYRDQDPGWTVTGQVPSPFITGTGVNPNQQIDGDYLGWEPRVSFDSASYHGYDMT